MCRARSCRTPSPARARQRRRSGHTVGDPSCDLVVGRGCVVGAIAPGQGAELRDVPEVERTGRGSICVFLIDAPALEVAVRAKVVTLRSSDTFYPVTGALLAKPRRTTKRLRAPCVYPTLPWIHAWSASQSCPLSSENASGPPGPCAA